MRTQLSLLLLFTSVVAGCDNGPPASRIDRARVLGTRVSAASDPARASIAPGEAARIEVFTASSEKARGAYASFAWRACPSDGNPSTYRCAAADLALRDEPSVAGDPVLAFDAPAVPAEVLVFGVACASGAPTTFGDPLAGACTDGVGQEVAVRIDVGGLPNRLPVIPADAVRLDSIALAEGGAGCADTPRTIRADEAEHTFEIVSPAENLESGDTLVLSHMATHGELDRLYSTLDSSPTFSVTWKAPKELGADRETARFYFVLRDGRGGTAFAMRTICLSRGG